MAGRDPQLRRIVGRISERLCSVLGHELGEVGLQPDGEVLPLVGIEVGHQVPHPGDEGHHLGACVDGLLAHAISSWGSSRRWPTASAKSLQSSACRFSSARPAGVMP